jgi:hypothetical protein
MKKFQFTLSIVFLLLAINLKGQNNYEEVLYLKNGSVIRGVVIEQVPDQTVKIQTKDKNIFVYQFNEIEKITKEEVHAISNDQSQQKSSNNKSSNDNSTKCLNGQLDAENYHGKKGTHFVLGVLFGPFAMIGTAVSEPKPQRSKQTLMMSNNKDQFNDPNYLSCYKKKAKGQLIGMEALGWGSWILLLLIL